ncbi:MAG: hypothetical protein ABI432_19995 [Flavobacteriales bacterium]
MFNSIRTSENFHILLWLLKDLCWVMDLKLLGVIMIGPTLAMALFIAWRCRQELGELLHSIAVVFWIMANSTWMIGEFFFADGTRPLAMCFFIAGILTVLWYYLIVWPSRMRAARNDRTTQA